MKMLGIGAGVGVAIGLVFAWGAYGGGGPDSFAGGEDRKTLERRPNSTGTRAAARAREMAARGRGEKFEDLKFENEEEREEFITGLAAWEVLPVLEELMRGTDPVTGMSYGDRAVFKRLLAHWGDVDPDAMVAWVVASFSRERAEDMVLDWLKEKVGLSAEEKFALAEKYFDAQAVSELAGDLIVAFREQGLTTELAMLCIPRIEGGDSVFRMETKFAEGFEFRRVAMRMLETHELATSEKGHAFAFGTMPAGMIEAWAKESPQEALDFYFGLENKQRSMFGTDSGDLIAAVHGTLERGERGPWLVRVMGQLKEEKGFRESMARRFAAGDLENGESLSRVFEHVEDPASWRAATLAAELGMRRSSNTAASLERVLALYDSREQLLEELERADREPGAGLRLSPSDEHFKCLKNRGWSEDELARFRAIGE